MIKPKHQQLFDLLTIELKRGAYPTGTKLPTIKELAHIYDVSINVVSKTVDLLRSSGMVTVKVGEGVFSNTSGVASQIELKYSGERIFGSYANAKQLSILIEDSAEYQRPFWNRFLSRFSELNLDIELKITYGQVKNEANSFDLGVGSPTFLNQNGFSEPETLSAEEANIFYPELYNFNAIITPEKCSDSKFKVFYPYGFTNYHLASGSALPPPKTQESVLDYIERLAKNLPPSAKLGYGLCNGFTLLLNEGIQYCISDDMQLIPPEPEHLLSVFERTRKLYRAGHLIWEHGHFHNYSEELLKNVNSKISPLNIIEESFNTPGELKNYPFPFGKSYNIIVFGIMIKKDCVFPEECLRMVKMLLDKPWQKSGFEHKIFKPIRIEMLDVAEQKVVAELPVETRQLVPLKFQEAINYFVTWEFYNYVNGKRNSEVVALLANKIQWYLDHK